MKKSESVKEEQKIKKSVTELLPNELEIVSGLAQIKGDNFGEIDASFDHKINETVDGINSDRSLLIKTVEESRVVNAVSQQPPGQSLIINRQNSIDSPNAFNNNSKAELNNSLQNQSVSQDDSRFG